MMMVVSLFPSPSSLLFSLENNQILTVDEPDLNEIDLENELNGSLDDLAIADSMPLDSDQQDEKKKKQQGSDDLEEEKKAIVPYTTDLEYIEDNFKSVPLMFFFKEKKTFVLELVFHG